MTLRPLMTTHLAALSLLSLSALAVAGCATVRPDSASVTVSGQAPPPRVLTAAELRAAAVSPAELGGGYTVSLLGPGQSAPAPGGAQRQLADLPACQPVLDVIGPADPAAQPQAEADLTVAKGGAGQGADPGGDLYIALLGYPGGRAAALQSMLDQVLARCASFTSGVQPAEGAAATPDAAHRTSHRLTRVDTPTPEGADGATAFTLTSEPGSGGVTLVRRAAVVRVGRALAVFSTVSTAKEAAAGPDPVVLTAQTRKLRAVQL